LSKYNLIDHVIYFTVVNKNRGRTILDLLSSKPGKGPKGIC
jgi:hypothetical protein